MRTKGVSSLVDIKRYWKGIIILFLHFAEGFIVILASNLTYNVYLLTYVMRWHVLYDFNLRNIWNRPFYIHSLSILFWKLQLFNTIQWSRVSFAVHAQRMKLLLHGMFLQISKKKKREKRIIYNNYNYYIFLLKLFFYNNIYIVITIVNYCISTGARRASYKIFFKRKFCLKTKYKKLSNLIIFFIKYYHIELYYNSLRFVNQLLRLLILRSL